MMNTCEKRTYEQYVEFFKENKPQIIKSMEQYCNDHEESVDEEECEKDFTQEIIDEEDHTIDYNFYYKIKQKA